MMDAAVITCALCGARSRKQFPGIPATPEQFAEEARRVWDAGASVVHVHARDPLTGDPSHKAEHFRDIVSAVREATPDLLINLTTGGGGLSPAERVRPVSENRPDFGTLSMGSLTLADYNAEERRFRYDLVLRNSFEDIAYMARAIADAGALVDYEFYEAGHVENLNILRLSGVDVPGAFSLILGIDGAMPADVFSLAHLVRMLPPRQHWGLVVPKSARHWSMIAAGLGAGGGVRVGYEDCPYLPDGTIARSNGDLVTQAAKIAAAMGRPIADASMARAIFGDAK